MYSHKLQAVRGEFLIPKRREYPYHRKWPVAEAMIDKSGILEILEVFVKELDVFR